MQKLTFARSRQALYVAVALSAALTACTGMRPGYETPTVTVNAFRALPSQGALPNFEIGLHVINPNAQPLSIRGLSYTVSLEGHELVKGVANDLPEIEAYGEGNVTVTAAANLFAGIRLISELMSGPRDSFSYSLEAKLDVGTFIPAIRIRDAGQVALRSTGGN